MLFNSIAFLIFLPLVFFTYWKLLAKSLHWQNMFVLVASYFFYGWWDWRFLILIFISSLADYIVGPYIEKANSLKTKRLWFSVSLIVNLGMLGFFKYYNFFVDSFIDSFSFFGYNLSKPALSIILPVGISFYTFQTLSYSIDIYRGRIKATHDFVPFFAFVSFFPQLVAGPIERASHLLPQFQKTRTFNADFAISGLRIMLWGFFKKVVISDNLAPVVDSVYASPDLFGGTQIWMASILFSLQVYTDFSGYSDIAIGCGRLLGFDLMTNFKTPYFSRTFAEFWNRWHISLNTWFRDYVYIPLGGSRVSDTMWSANILIVFTISGFWHGASWTYIFWGALCAVFIIYARFTQSIGNRMLSGIGLSQENWFKHVYDVVAVFMLFTFTLIFFRANNSSDLFVLLDKAFYGTISDLYNPIQSLGSALDIFTSARQMSVLFLSVGFLFVVDLLLNERDFADYLKGRPTVFRWTSYFLITAWIILFGAFSRPENFVYFQF
ncbi:MAG TPA: membrane-bound O-acyltransferase family protein [Flavobacteriales bacterium]|nr:membrane-bound O-acyltransferase family protein [Flavobacteriales bacterium]